MNVRLKLRQAAKESASGSYLFRLQTKMCQSSDLAFERQLRDLAVEAQRNPAKSLARQRALTRLIAAIASVIRLDFLRKYAHNLTPAEFSDLCEEAEQETYRHACEKIELYRPEYAVMAWVHSTLKFKFFEVCKKRRQRDTSPYDPEVLEQIAPLTPRENRDMEYQKLQEFLSADPEGKLAAYTIRNRPELTFQFLAIERVVRYKTWQELATQTESAIQTLSCFYNRTLQKLLPYFRRYL